MSINDYEKYLTSPKNSKKEKFLKSTFLNVFTIDALEPVPTLAAFCPLRMIRFVPPSSVTFAALNDQDDASRISIVSVDVKAVGDGIITSPSSAFVHASRKEPSPLSALFVK